MDQQLDLARKKTVVLSAVVGVMCMAILIVPPIAVRHGVRAVWIVLPQCAIAAVLMVSLLLSLKDFLALKKGRHGLQ